MNEHFVVGMLIVFAAGLLNGSFTLPMKYSRTWSWEHLWTVYSLYTRPQSESIACGSFVRKTCKSLAG